MRIGVLGAGQLGRMMVLAGIPLGLRFLMYDRRRDAPGAVVAPIVCGAFDDLRALERFARAVDVVTFDWENVPAASLRAIRRHVPVWPSPRALAIGQDRLSEKNWFRRLGIPVAPYAAVYDRRGLDRAVAAIGLPGLLKSRRLGYDGKGQALIRRVADAESAWRRLGGRPLVYERYVHFTREVSLLAARDHGGRVVCYPLAENVHDHGILVESRAPCGDARLQRAAERAVRRLLAELRYVGVICVEFFVERGRLLANEMAPRVHNTGHWTIEGAETSQFENHLRAIAGLPLGSTCPRGHAVMQNLIGRLPPARALLRLPGVHWHDYGKSARPGRKLGHLTVVSTSRRARDAAAARLRRLIQR